MLRAKVAFGLALGGLLLVPGRAARAYILPLPASLAADALSESTPTAFAPNSLEASDFALEWQGLAIPGVEVSLAERSLQWVRVADVLVLPRARLMVSGAGSEGGAVANAGFTQAFADGRAELPVALISGESNPIEIAVVRQGRQVRGRLLVRFKPRQPEDDGGVYADASCSRFGVSAATPRAQEGAGDGGPLPRDSRVGSVGRGQWVYVGCRVAEVRGAEHRTSSLEAFVYWDGVGQSIRIGGVDTPSTLASTWPLRLRSSPGRVALQSGSSELALTYFTPEYFHRGYLGMGLGPYQYTFTSPGEAFTTLTGSVTLYGSYFITEAMRLVGFGDLTVEQHFNSDFGIYLNSEYIRTIDRRLSINLMLGAHVIGIRAPSVANNSYYVIFGAPQGAEVIFYDFLGKGYNLSLGGFLYPKIDGSAYDNVWIRYGHAALFLEFNYISWQETVLDQDLSSRSVGFSLGFPLGRFL